MSESRPWVAAHSTMSGDSIYERQDVDPAFLRMMFNRNAAQLSPEGSP